MSKHSVPGRDFAGLRAQLLAAGCPPDMPAAIVSRASSPGERYRTMTAGDLHTLPQMPSPAVLLIGRSLDRAQSRAASEASLAFDEAELILSSLEA